MTPDIGTPAFRELRPADYADALMLYQELAGDTSFADDAGGKERFRQILAHPGTTIWGAEVQGAVLSMATLHILPNMTFDGRPYCLIENVVTRRSAQGRGLGRGVMQVVMAATWAANAYKIMLLTGKVKGAKGFYEKLGFTNEEKFGMVLIRAPMRKPLG
jgi:GNAT superfamily N-acetyltransferase